MNATYIFDSNFSKIEFQSKPLSIEKCLQIKRIAESNKTWKGFYLVEIKIASHGLDKLHIKQV